MEFTNVGAGWIKQEEGKKARISVKLENGMFMSIFKNEKKEQGSNQPDYNLTMNVEDAEKMGLMKEQQNKAEQSKGEVDISEIPF